MFRLGVDDARFARDGSVAMVLDAPRRSLPASADDLREWVRRQEFYKRVGDHLAAARRRPDLIAGVPGNAYVVNTGASAIALAAATAKTIFYINAPASNQPSLVELAVGFDGVTASNTPALVELVYGTKATNSTPGTGSTSFTPLQLRGWPAQASAQAAANNCTSEPTVLTSMKQWLLTPNGGLLVVQAPLGREPTGIASGTAASGNQIGCRVTAPQTVNTRGYVEYEE
jgi:hypothetical protein